MICSKCNADNPNEAKFCHMCGAPFRKNVKWWQIIASILLMTGVLTIPFRSCENEIYNYNYENTVDYSQESTKDVNYNSFSTVSEEVETTPEVEYYEEPSYQYSEPSYQYSGAAYTDIYYIVTANEAKLYDYYMVNNDRNQTYMGDLNLVYKKGAVIKGEICTLDNLGTYIMVHWNDKGTERRGFISINDVEEAYRQ